MPNLDPATLANLEGLTIEQRANLAAFLIDSLDSEIDGDAQDAWEKEIARRIADLDAGKSKTLSKAAALDLILAKDDDPENG